jgi:hypothetical protein
MNKAKSYEACVTGTQGLRLPILGLVTLTVVMSGNRLEAGNDAVAPIVSARTVAAESGVVPPGTSLLVRANDTVTTRKAYRGTVYSASLAADILDQNGAILIPKESAIEMVVRSVPYLGPGGVGMTLLTLDIDAVTVGNVRYPVETDDKAPGAGGIGVNDDPVKWVGGKDEAANNVVTRGGRINVPSDTVLAFQIQAPIRLQGYQR